MSFAPRDRVKRTTIFTWGYYGWGNHTRRLIRAVDLVERERGFNPPIFVDIRIRRNVRAAGFTGPAFERLLGPGRYRWMKSLGNRFIETRTGPRVQIASPTAAAELLDVAIESGRNEQRVLFFCSCQWPRCDGKISCHRTTVARLLLKEARKRGTRLQVVEWPGGEPKHTELGVTPEVFDAVRRGRMSVPLGKRAALAAFAGMPWCSIVTLASRGEKLHRIVGPAIVQRGEWVLPVLFLYFDPATDMVTYRKQAEKVRRSWGLAAMG